MGERGRAKTPWMKTGGAKTLLWRAGEERGDVLGHEEKTFGKGNDDSSRMLSQRMQKKTTTNEETGVSRHTRVQEKL